MGGLLGGGGSSNQVQYVPYNAGGTGQGGTVYTPTNQPAFDQNYQNLVASLQNMAFDPQGNGPFEFAPYAGQNALNITPQVNPYAPEQIQGAISTGGYLTGLGQGAEGAAAQYAGIPGAISGLAGKAAGGVDPTQQLARLITGGIGPTQQLAGQVASYLPAVGNLASGVAALAPGVTAGIAPLQQGASQILQTGYDPQSALYEGLRQESLDRSNAINSMAGLGSSPYGAGLTSDALDNLSVNWQNQQLARQQEALQAAGTGYQAGGALSTTAGRLLGEAGNLYGQAGGLGGQAGSLYGSAAGQAGQGANVYGSAAGQAGQAASIAGGVIPAAGQNLQLGGAGANAAMSGYGLPYSTSVAQSQAALPALQSASNLGLEQLLWPQQVLQDIQSYLKLGQSASEVSATLGQTGFNEGQQQLSNIGASLSGLGSLIGGATGSNLTGLGGIGAGIGSGISGLGGLFGFGGGAADAATAADLLAPGGLTAGDLVAAGGPSADALLAAGLGLF